LIEQFIKNQNRVINNAEKKLLRDLNKLYPQQWVFVGDGSMIVNGKNPDFYNADKNLLIELFGDYWHQNDDPQERINLFREKGYNTLVLWEHELKNKTALRETIIDFVESH
jgi:very-short-patch-repair endonuclease